MPKPKSTPDPSGSPAAVRVTRSVGRAYVSAPVRRDLWIAAGGRCEFRGCCKPVDRDFLTKKAKSVVGEFAHIIADSPAGARGVAGLSEKLAADPSNLMLACFARRQGRDNGATCAAGGNSLSFSQRGLPSVPSALSRWASHLASGHVGRSSCAVRKDRQ